MGLSNRGFTLIELIVTMAVLAVVAAMAIPSFSLMVKNNSSSSMSSELQGALALARVEAVKRAARVSICPSIDGASCLTASDWAKGWMVFVDTAASDTTATATVGSVIKIVDGLDKNAVITATKDSTAISFLRFNSIGMLARLNGADVTPRVFHVKVNNCTGTFDWQISVGVTGLISVSKAACN